MLYERSKLLSAFATVISVAIGLGTVAEIGPTVRLHLNAILIAAALAAFAAVLSITASRRLARERERGTVFIIYAREDLESAQQLAHRLRGIGLEPWLDVEKLRPGQEWRKEIAQQIERSAAAVVLVSKNMAKQGYVQAEVRQALDVLQSRSPGFSPVLPVRIDDSLPPERLRAMQWIDLRDDADFAVLGRALRQTLRHATA